MIFYNDIFNDLYDDESYRFVAERIQDSAQSMSFLNDEFKDIDTWKGKARQFIRERFLYSPPEVPFDGVSAGKEDFGDHTREKIYFSSAPGYRIPAYLLVPKNLRAPAPGIVALHDHGAMFFWGKDKSVDHKNWNPVLKNHMDICYSGQPVASMLAKRGYVVLVTDSLFFGERSYKAHLSMEYKKRLDGLKFESPEYITEYNNICFEIESDLVRAIYHAGYTFMGIRTWDDMASVGYLCSRPEVDAERIGCVGLSMGGHRSAWLSAMDDRIKCAVVVGWMARHSEMNRYRFSNNPWMWVVPGMYGSLDYPDMASLSAPKPLMVIHGEKDMLYVHGTAEKAIDLVGRVYKKCGHGENFVFEIYDGPHEFNAEMQDRAYKWLDRHLV